MSNTHEAIFLSNADGTLEEYANNLSSGGEDTSTLANKTDLTAIILTGTTNTSGDTITAGTWFYLNGTPCIAKVDIASGATFTEGTNYEEKTIGSELSELNSNIVLSSSMFSNTVNDFNFQAGYKNGRIVSFLISGTISGEYGNLCTIADTNIFPLMQNFQVNAYIVSGGYEIPTFARIRNRVDIYVVNKGISNSNTIVSAIYTTAQ